MTPFARHRYLLSRLCLVVVVSVLSASTTVAAGKFNRQLSVGDPAPAWEGLRGVDGQLYSLKAWKDAPAVVVVFYANRCPVAEAYESRLLQLAADVRERGVRFVAISVSHHDSDRFEKMQQRAHERSWKMPYVQDLTQEIARKYGVTTTSQVFLLNADRRIAYMGAIDDQWKDATKVETHYLRDALTAVLAGKPVDITETRPVGCEIEYIGSKSREE